MYFGLLLQWAVNEVRGCAQFIFKQKNITHSFQPGFWKKSNFSVLIEPRLICEGSNTAFFQLDTTNCKLTTRTTLNTKMQNSEMGIPLVIFSNERKIGFDHLARRPGNYSKQLTRVVF